MEHGRINKKKLFTLIAIFMVLLIIGGIIFYILHNKNKEEVSFEENDKLYFAKFAELYEQDEYEFYSLDAYYLEDTQMYYYNAKYKAYISIEDAWYDIDQIYYGAKQKFYNMYCRSWDQLYGFEEVDKEFERAKKEGIHNTYTKEEINKLLEEAYKENK